MKITMLGSLGNINQITVPQLIKAGHEVTVISTNPKRVAAIEELGAHAAIGNMQDESFLTQTLAGQDVVYLMLSGSAGEDLYDDATNQAKTWSAAIESSGVKNVVNLSSIGAEADEVAGSLYAYHLIENELRKINNVNLAFVRPTGFYANLFSNLSTIKSDHTIYSNNPDNLQQKFVAPIDIANVVLPLIQNTPNGITARYVFSDTFTGREFMDALKIALEIPDLKWVQISDQQYLAGLTNHGVPESVAEGLLQTSHYQRHPETVYADLNANNPSAGSVKLADFVKIFSAAYHGEGNHRSNTLADK